jgi:hypothetical protein
MADLAKANMRILVLIGRLVNGFRTIIIVLVIVVVIERIARGHARIKRLERSAARHRKSACVGTRRCTMSREWLSEVELVGIMTGRV